MIALATIVKAAPLAKAPIIWPTIATMLESLKAGIRSWRICEPITPPAAPEIKFRAEWPLLSKSATANPPAIPTISQMMRETVSGTTES
jgi:hypothetical protein